MPAKGVVVPLRGPQAGITVFVRMSCSISNALVRSRTSSVVTPKHETELHQRCSASKTVNDGRKPSGVIDERISTRRARSTVPASAVTVWSSPRTPELPTQFLRKLRHDSSSLFEITNGTRMSFCHPPSSTDGSAMLGLRDKRGLALSESHRFPEDARHRRTGALIS